MQTPEERWLPLENTRMTPEGRWESMVQFESSSEWFSGHFEECPLVPGVALLAVAEEVLKRQGREQGRRLMVSAFSRVRFRRLVSPGEGLHISMAAMPSAPQATLDFHIACRGETVAQGFLKAGEEVFREGEK